MGRLSGETIVIIGGSQGIGLATAKRCAAEGASLLLAARSETSLDSALAEISAVNPAKHRSYVLDVSDSKAVCSFAEWCSSRQDRIKGVVNCAGILGPIGKTTEVPLDEFITTLNINLFGALHVCRAFAPILRSDTRKKIILFSGGGATSALPFYSAYACSKVALVRLCENLSIELEDEGIDINCIAPGFVATRMHEDTLKAGPGACGKDYFEKTKRLLTEGSTPPERAADLCIFLLSEESDRISGRIISAPWDDWENPQFRGNIQSNPSFGLLRRIDNMMFFSK